MFRVQVKFFLSVIEQIAHEDVGGLHQLMDKCGALVGVERNGDGLFAAVIYIKLIVVSRELGIVQLGRPRQVAHGIAG